MRPDTALYQLKNMPEMFLRTNCLSISGSARSGPAPYELTADALYTGNASVNEKFRFAPSLHRGKLVHNVRMIPSGEAVDIRNMEPYVLGASITPDIMLTGQLTGCVFAAKVLGDGRVIVAHIQPGGQRPGGEELRQMIMEHGSFQGYGEVTHVFGRGDYADSANVVGIRDGQGQWSIYGQVFNRLTQIITDVALITTTDPWKPWFRSNPRGVRYVD